MKFKFLTCLLLAALSFSACKQDMVEEVIEDIEISEMGLAVLTEMDENKENRRDCFEFVYPIAFNMPDGTSISGADEVALKENIRAWYIANPESRERPSLVLPVELVFKDKDMPVTIENGEGLRKVYAACKGEEEKEEDKKCFKFIYPISYTMPDGSTITGANEEEVDGALKDWYEVNPDTEEKPALQFPVQVFFADRDDIITIDSVEGLRRIYAACKGDEGEHEEDKKCFKFIYPISYTMPDGSTITGANEEEVDGALKDWYEVNPDTEEKPALQFPVQVFFADRDDIITIDSVEGLRRIYAACKGDEGEDHEERCFDFIYPISYTMPDGSTITGEDARSLRAAIGEWYQAHPDNREEPTLQFPVQVSFADRDDIITIESQEGLRRIYAACDDEGDSDNDEDCFEIIYPISYTMPDGSIITGENARSLRAAIGEWYEAHPDNREKAMLNFPIDVNFPDVGVITVEDEETLKGLRERCGG